MMILTILSAKIIISIALQNECEKLINFFSELAPI